MFLSNPGKTAYDIEFKFAGFPVRIHPLFWAIALFISYSPQNLPATTARVACVALSILVHEFGHAWTARFFGAKGGHIVLHGMGGLAYHRGGLSRVQNIVMIAAGPGAGFVLAGVVFLIRSVPMLNFPGPLGAEIMYFLLYVNIFWGVLNLIPIYPLDGGQICMNIMQLWKGRSGEVIALRISVFFGVAGTLWLATGGRYFGALIVGSLVWESFKLLSAGGPSALQEQLEPWQKRSDHWKD
jgi:stage IV sporulation protein FB